jgi:hypothetical protein
MANNIRGKSDNLPLRSENILNGMVDFSGHQQLLWRNLMGSVLTKN